MNYKQPKKPLNPIAAVIGIILILVGLGALLPIALGTLWIPVREVISWVSRLIWPLSLVVAGIFVVYLAATGGFGKITNRVRQTGFTPPAPGTRLYRSTSDKWLAGVCGGLAHYFHADPSIIRLIVAIIFFFTGFWPVGAAYVAAWLIIPVDVSTY